MEPFLANVRRLDQEAVHSSSVILAMAMASGRSIHTDQRRDALSLCALEHQGEVLKVFATKFLKRTMKCYGGPRVIVTDRLGSYGAAMKVIGVEDRQICGQWLNNRAENSHQPFRRREGAMARFTDIKTLQKFAAAHASIHNHFNQERHLYNRENFKLNRSAALAEWRQLAA